MKQVTAVKACQEAGLDFAECFKWQYIATEAQDIDIPMNRHSVGSWSIYTGKGLAFTKLVDASGAVIGCLLGIGVDEKGLASDVHSLEADANSDQFFEQIEKWLHVLAGRYTAFVFNGVSKRIYSDAVGMNGCVYNAKTRIVASSVLLTLDRPLKDHPRYPKDHIENGGKYSLFHTSDPDVSRCNPSYYIDLATFEEVRFWPGNHTFTAEPAEPADLANIYDRLQQRTKFIVEAICKDAPVAFPISGGQDSRFLLALAGPAIRKIDYFFTHIHNYAGRIDANIAAELARRLQITHHVIDKRKLRASKAVIDTTTRGFRIACGYSAKPPREMELGLMQQMPADHIVMRGHLTDILRAVFIDRLGPRARRNFRWQLKRLLIVPGGAFDETTYSNFLPDYQSWSETLPAASREHLVDLMFMEIYYSSTVGCTFPALSQGFFMSPFNSRELVEQCMRVPEVYRRKSAAIFDCIHRFNPSLADVPMDYEFGGGRGLDKILDLSEMKAATRARRDFTLHRYDRLLRGGDYTWTELDEAGSDV